MTVFIDINLCLFMLAVLLLMFFKLKKIAYNLSLKFHLELSLFISNGASVGVLSPEDTSANFSFEFGTTLGIIL